MSHPRRWNHKNESIYFKEKCSLYNCSRQRWPYRWSVCIIGKSYMLQVLPVNCYRNRGVHATLEHGTMWLYSMVLPKDMNWCTETRTEVKSEFLRRVTLKPWVSWKWYGIVWKLGYQYYEVTCCLHLYPEHAGSKFLWSNVT
jgi:hypothetical protein